MNGETPLTEVREGLATLLVPDIPRGKGPGKNTGQPFYNPTMERNRDMTVLFLRALNRPGMKVFDGLAASGALGLRVALEVPGSVVTSNDRNPAAVELVRRNAELNGVRLQAITNDRFQTRVAMSRYDFIDVDPFGTPVPYLDSAFQTAPRDGFVAVTATDTAVLCGAQSKACVRRYEARPLHIDCCKEIALRILAGFCTRTAARYEKAATPSLSFSADHYLRVFLKVGQGVQKADDALSLLGFVVHDKKSGERLMTRERPAGGDWAGPLWAGNLVDSDLVGRLAPGDHMRHATSLLAEQLRGESGSPPLFVTSEYLARLTSSSPPPMTRLLGAIEAAGFTAHRTHFDQLGVKTNASWGDLLRIYRACSR